MPEVAVPPPGGEPVKPAAARIYVMPEQFLAVTRGAGLPVQKAPPPPVAAAVQQGKAAAAPAPPKPAPAPAAPVAPTPGTPTGLPAVASAKAGPGIPMEEGKRKMIVIWGGVAAVILIGGGLAAFFALRSVKPPAPPTPPAPRPVNVAPPAPVNIPPVNIAPPTTPEPEPEPPPPAPDRDTDSDGLTDAEELLIGTDIGLADSDGDSYPDAQELVNLYNPAGVAPQRLLDAGLVYAYEHPTQGWSIYLPRQWSIAATGQEQRELLVNLGINTEEVLIRSATASMLGTCEGTERAVVRTKRGAEGCRSTAMIPLEGEAFGTVAEFSLGEGGLTLHMEFRLAATVPSSRYPHLFEMIVQSFAGPANEGMEN